MRFFRNIRALRKDLSAIFITSIVIIILIDFWLIDIPEKFNGGAKIGQIFYKLSFSYVSAFIFYFLVVHLKNQKDKENLYSFIGKYTLRIISTAKDVAKVLSDKSTISIKNEYPNKDELKQICKAIDPNSKAPLIWRFIREPEYANWIQYFEYSRLRTNEAYDKILSKSNFLDSELVQKLAKIEDCTHFSVISIFVKNMPTANPDLTQNESPLSEYFDLIKDLEEYYNRKLKNYQ